MTTSDLGPRKRKLRAQGIAASLLANWKVWLERAAMFLIALGIVMLVQGIWFNVFGTGFVVIIVGTLLFIVVSHL